MNVNEPKPNPNGFVDPYGGLEHSHKTRTTIDVSSAARADLSSVYPKKGVLQTTINILVEKLRQELKRCGLDSYQPELYERAVADATILLGGFRYRFHPSGAAVLIDDTPNPDGRSSVGQPARKRKGRKPTEANCSDDGPGTQ